MKRNAISMGIGILALFFSSTVYPTFADRINPRTIIEGTIKNVDNDSIVIDSAVEAQDDVRIQVDNDTLFKQAASLGDFGEGDAVMVSFKEENNEKVAVYIAKVYPVGAYTTEGDYLERSRPPVNIGSDASSADERQDTPNRSVNYEY